MKRKTTELFTQDAWCKHGDKYNYKLVEYKNNSTKVKIICSIHGIFEQRPNKHSNGQGCKECGKITTKTKQRRTTEQFIQDAWCKHGDKYNYKLVEYKNTHTKIDIICPVHGIFKQSPKNHLVYGCNGCGYDITKKKVSLDIDDVKKYAELIHNNKYDYSLVDYIKKKDKVKIICPEHGIFLQRVENHLYGQGCPKCSNGVSKQEQELQEWLSDYIDIKCNDRSIIKPLELDIVIPSKKIAIEYNGLYWHSESGGKDKRYHLNKYNLCKEKGYRLIQIWENEWLLHKDIVKSIILNAIGKHIDKIHGRKCEIRTVAPKEARPFYNDNHIQGFKGGEHHGLYYKGNLVSLLTMKKHLDIVLLERFVNKKNVIVHGAFSKLLKSFNIKCDIDTFTDLRYFTGDVYKNNGFEFKYQIKPNFWYFKNSTIKIIHRMSLQKKRLPAYLNEYDDGITGDENIKNNGYHKIWDCGNLKFTLKNP